MQNNPLDMRLQNLIAGWQGIQRGQPLGVLHQECVDIVGRDNPLLPRSVYLVKDLDSTTLQVALKHTSAQVRFQAMPQGRFDAALVPVSSTDSRGQVRLNRFVLAVEQALSLADQVALYAHAFGHLLLNYQARLLENQLNLNPDSGMAHYDRLSELRYVEKIRSKADRDVLESFPKLAALIEPQSESMAQVVAAAQSAVTRLRGRDWSRFLVTPYEYTSGRVLPGSARRGRKRSVDVLMQASSSLPIAVLHSQRAGEAYIEAEQRVQDAAERLAVPFAYLLELDGRVHEFDYKEGGEPVHTICADVPTHEELVERWLAFLQLSEDREILTVPYYQSPQGKRPRYYQDAAINRALVAILQARRGLREKRVLLVLATGTGKTHIAFQLLWKLKQKRVVRNVLFLADRTYLLNQAQIGDFAPLNDRIWMAGGDSKTSRDIVLASYQWMTRMQDGSGHYHDYPRDYFDLIIVDECHRGSANEDSLWRDVLEYFSEAVQVGLTATPLESKGVHTSEYFGPSVYTYPLSKGINDGFLAPYRVRRVLLGPEAGEDVERDESASPSEENTLDPLRDASTTTLADALVMETREKMRQYTQAIAEHLAAYLEQTDARAKTIVFCVDNEHAAQMRDALQAASANWARTGDVVRIVVDDQQEGKRDLNNFCSVEEKQPVVVTTSKLLSTGIDAPTCKNIVLARAVGSMVEFKQIIGRGTRLFGKGKTWFTILDYAGAIKHFFDPTFDGNPEFIVNEPLTPRPSSTDASGEPAQPAHQPETTDDEPGQRAEMGKDAQAGESSTDDVSVSVPPPTAHAQSHPTQPQAVARLLSLAIKEATRLALGQDLMVHPVGEWRNFPHVPISASFLVLLQKSWVFRCFGESACLSILFHQEIVLHREYDENKENRMYPRSCVAAVIIHDENLLVVKKRDAKGIVYSFPTGGQEAGETLVQAVEREVLEEVGCTVQVGPLLWVREYIGKHHENADLESDVHVVCHLFHCTISSVSHIFQGSAPDPTQEGVEWLPLTQLATCRFYPQALIPFLIEQGHGIPSSAPLYVGDVN